MFCSEPLPTHSLFEKMKQKEIISVYVILPPLMSGDPSVCVCVGGGGGGGGQGLATDDICSNPGIL